MLDKKETWNLYNQLCRLFYPEQYTIYHKKYYIRDREHILDQKREYHINNKEVLNKKSKKYYNENNMKCKTQQKQYRVEHKAELRIAKKADNDKVKFETFSHYTQSDGIIRCACLGCPFKYIGFLELDHVNNDGKAQRQLGGLGGTLYRYLRRNNYPQEPKLQLLCSNCNRAKRTYKECPLYGKDHVTGL